MPIVSVINKELTGDSTAGYNFHANVEVKLSQEELDHNHTYQLFGIIYQPSTPVSPLVMLYRMAPHLMRVVLLDGKTPLQEMHTQKISQSISENIYLIDIPISNTIFEPKKTLYLETAICLLDGDVQSPHNVGSLP